MPLDYDAVQCQESTPVPDNAQINQPLRELSSDTSPKSKSLLTNAQFFLPDFADTGESPGHRAWMKMLGAVVGGTGCLLACVGLSTGEQGLGYDGRWRMALYPVSYSETHERWWWGVAARRTRGLKCGPQMCLTPV